MPEQPTDSTPMLDWIQEDGREDPEQRFALIRLCECGECGGRGKHPLTFDFAAREVRQPVRCEACRGEGRVRELVATCATPEAVGVALVTLGREGEWDECPIGVLDRMPECEHCGGVGGRHATVACSECYGTGIKPTGTWIVRPWLPSARNVSDAARTLGKEGARKRSSRIR